MDVLSEAVVECIILGIDSIILGICFRQLCKCKQIISGLQSAPVLDIDGNIKEEICKYPEKVVPYVVLRGIVRPLGNPIRSNYNSSVTGVIQKLTIKEHVVARTPAGFWSDQTRTIHEVFNSTPFVLTNGHFQVEVVDALAADLLEMDVISDKFEPMTTGVMDHLWGFFSGVRQRGLQTMEEMLRDGSYITCVGELSQRADGSLKIQPPKDGLPLYLTTSSKNGILTRLQNSRDVLRILLGVFGTVAVVVSVRILYKYLKKRRKQREDEEVKRRLAIGRRERRAGARDRNLSATQLCIVCTENPKEIILLPCGHVCLCEDCADNIRASCPVCRNNIETKAPAFIT